MADRMLPTKRQSIALQAQSRDKSHWTRSQSACQSSSPDTRHGEVCQDGIWQVLIDAHKIQITVKDILTLAGLEWLNDEVINFYMEMIKARAEEDRETYRSV